MKTNHVAHDITGQTWDFDFGFAADRRRLPDAALARGVHPDPNDTVDWSRSLLFSTWNGPSLSGLFVVLQKAIFRNRIGTSAQFFQPQL